MVQVTPKTRLRSRQETLYQTICPKGTGEKYRRPFQEQEQEQEQEQGRQVGWELLPAGLLVVRAWFPSVDSLVSMLLMIPA